jgi:DNA polymerase III alpha subunit
VESLKQLVEKAKNNFPELVNHPEFKKRLKQELIEIEVQDEEQYFIDLVNQNKKYEINTNNLLIPVLLGICDNVDLDQDAAFKMGDFPDVDVDYLPIVRDYLKNEWAPKTFGEHNVCSIGNYGTFGLKSSLIDMVRVHGLDRNEILNITTKMGLKDDEGAELTLDKALEIYPELKAFLDKYPEIEKAVRKLLHRNRSMGKHAGGLIICNNRIDNFVPLVRGTDGNPVSAWVEGLHGQDLGPVGLIKFDLLVVDGLYQIALTCNMVKERHNIQSICALQGDWDWSDTTYLNDPESLAMANRADLRCIFQFDSEGIRALVLKGGVTAFDDLVAYVSLFRPSCLQMGMDQEYVLRKKGLKKYEIPDILQHAVGGTCGVLIYQEQVMQILNIVGKIPLRDCYQVIKAISKKKLSAFQKYKEKFIENGQITLGKNQKEMEEYFALIESFAGYGFNLSHATAYSYLSARQLYLKSHYPIEFYCSSLICKDADDKKREYITEAINHGIDVCPLNLNKSKETFAIVDGKIYIGFSNIKGIGEDKAKRIVELQPYAGFVDFLDRYGTEANVAKALIGLKVFDEADPITLYKFWLVFTDHKKSIRDKEKRFLANEESCLNKLKELVPNGMKKALEAVVKLNPAIFQTVLEHLEKKEFDNKTTIIAEARKLHKKYMTSLLRFNTTMEKVEIPSLENFDKDKVEIDDVKMMPNLLSKQAADVSFYGFIWDNKVRTLSKYKAGCNFETMKTKHANDPLMYYQVMGIITEVANKKTAKGVSFANVSIMDDNFEIGRVTFWQDDYERFVQELKVGNCISIQAVPAPNGIPGFNFFGPPKHKRHLLPKKHLDYRLVLLEENKDGRNFD